MGLVGTMPRFGEPGGASPAPGLYSADKLSTWASRGVALRASCWPTARRGWRSLCCWHNHPREAQRPSTAPEQISETDTLSAPLRRTECVVIVGSGAAVLHGRGGALRLPSPAVVPGAKLIQRHEKERSTGPSSTFDVGDLDIAFIRPLYLFGLDLKIRGALE